MSVGTAVFDLVKPLNGAEVWRKLVQPTNNKTLAQAQRAEGQSPEPYILADHGGDHGIC